MGCGEVVDLLTPGCFGMPDRDTLQELTLT